MIDQLGIRPGDLLTMATVLVSATGVIMSMRGTLRLFGYRLDVLDATVEDLKREYGNNKLQDFEIARLKEDASAARQDAVLIRKEVFDLQRGRGYVVPDKGTVK